MYNLEIIQKFFEKVEGQSKRWKINLKIIFFTLDGLQFSFCQYNCNGKTRDKVEISCMFAVINNR